MRAMAICTTFILIPATLTLSRLVRYPVGESVPSTVYTAPFDPCDPAYKYLAPPPKDWAGPFGNNERTMLIHAVSELRMVVAAQGKRLIELEKRVKASEPVDPNTVKWLGWPVIAGEYSGIDPGFFSEGPPPDQWTENSVEIGLAENGYVVWKKVDPNEVKE